MTSSQDHEQGACCSRNALQDELMDARWQAHHFELKSANLVESLQQAYSANWNQNAVIIQLQTQVGNLQNLYSQSKKQKAGIQTEIKGLKVEHSHTKSELDRIQMDKEAAWQAVHKIGELFIGRSQNDKIKLSVNDNGELRDLVTRLVVDNKKQEGEVNHLRGVVDKLKKFRLVELSGEVDKDSELGNDFLRESLALRLDH